MFNNTKFLIVSLIFLSSINLLSFCKSNNKEKCLDFKEIVEFESYKKSLISDFKIDKDANKFILFNNPIASSFIVKLDKSNKELWKKSFAFESHNLFLDNKGNLIIIADYSGELDLNKDTKLNSSTKALLVLKINSKTGKLIKHFSIKTNYGINPNVSNIDESNNIYISGIYGGKSKYFEKIAYENSFILNIYLVYRNS